ncbi:MAG: AbrB/MazE/SpoVT family DNA-binding domain-containing protein [Candidatus Omnitrophica bacterium]|nr:AbrB/MazE/SpoVT family DNA-binding domain-containing protein [Candidatus Omnitrophota bacterium]
MGSRAIAKVLRNFEVCIPMKIRNNYNLHIGDYVEVESRKDGILLKPKTLIDKSQAYFWTKEWQEEEKKVDEDYKKGRYKTFKSVKAFLEDLDK